MRDVTIQLTDPLGIEFTVTVPEEKLYDAMRHYGAKGYTSGTIPPGGLRLPMANEEDFDWRLIGARQFRYDENGEEVIAVYHRGNVYKRRELPANPKFNLRRIIKYSRGARATDEEKYREGDGETQYVTLVVFAGENARKDERFATPKTARV